MLKYLLSNDTLFLINLLKIILLTKISINIDTINTITEATIQYNKYPSPELAYNFEEKTFCQMNGLTNESS